MSIEFGLNRLTEDQLHTPCSFWVHQGRKAEWGGGRQHIWRCERPYKVYYINFVVVNFFEKHFLI